MYHRVCELDADPQLLCVKPDSFVGQLRHLVSVADVVPLSEIRTTRSRRAVAVTFDDGYADNLDPAARCLASFSVPATVFVATGLIGGRLEFWWDRLEALLLHGRPGPEHLEIEIG